MYKIYDSVWKVPRIVLESLALYWGALLLMIITSLVGHHQRSAACKKAFSLLYSSTEWVLKKKSL